MTVHFKRNPTAIIKTRMMSDTIFSGLTMLNLLRRYKDNFNSDYFQINTPKVVENPSILAPRKCDDRRRGGRGDKT